MKKIISLILCAVMLLSCLMMATSCGKKDKDGDNETVDLNVDLNQKPTLNILMPNSGKSIDAVNNNPNAALIEQLTGYDVVYTQLPAGDAGQTLNTELMDKKPYHLMKLTKDQFSDLVSQDLLVDLTDALALYAPDVLANISAESWEVVTVDGRVYGIPERASSDNIENPIVLNFDLMLQLGIDEPETLEDFTAALAAMTAHLGRPALTFDKYTPLVPAISAAFGIYTYWQEYDINGQKEVRFYMNAPGYKDYVDYMNMLYNAGYIDVEVVTNSAADAVTRFVNGFTSSEGAKAGAIACSLWSVPSIVTSMQSNNVIGSSEAAGTLEDYLYYVRSLKRNASDPERVYRSSGYTYITAIPYYMANTTAYALDFVNSKIKDTDTQDNFRQMVLGTKDVHYYIDANGNYQPKDPAFQEKDDASYYMTGSNENKYTEYWLARVRKQAELFRAWDELMTDADEVGVYNVVDFTPPIEEYNSNRSAMEEYAQNQFYIMLKNGTGELNSYLTQLNGNKGGSEATSALNSWYYNVYNK